MLKIKLREYQEEVLRRIEGRDSYYVAHEPGLGKTAVMCGIISNRLEQLTSVDVLILAPFSILHQVKREIEKFCTKDISDRVVLVSGVGKKRIETIKNAPKGSIFIVNHESLSIKRLPETLAARKIKLLLVDEAHRFKDPRGKRSFILMKIADAIQWKFLFSGTPILNSESDIWAQLRLLEHEPYAYFDKQKIIFSSNYWAFLHTHFRDVNASFKSRSWYFPKWEIKPESLEPIKAVMNRYMHVVTKEEALDLPPLVKQQLVVPMLPEQRKLYNSIAENFVAALSFVNGEMHTMSVRLVVTQLLRLRQVSCGIFKSDEGGELEIECSKLKALEDLLPDYARLEKVIIWCDFIPLYRRVSDICDKLDLRFVSIVGGQKATERQEAIRGFQEDPTVRVCISNQQAGGIGINLQAGSVMFYLSKGFSRDSDYQSESRIYRSGSEIHKKITRIDFLSENSIDEDIHTALEQKKDLTEFMLGLKEKYGRNNGGANQDDAATNKKRQRRLAASA